MKSNLKRIFVLGGHTSTFIGKGSKNYIDKKHPLFGKKDNPTLKEYITETIKETFKQQGLPMDAEVPVDKAFLGNFAGELFCNQGHLGSSVAEAHPSLKYIPSCRVEAACSSGGIAIALAHESIKAGSDVVLVLGAEIQNSVSARIGGDYLARAADYDRQRKIDDFTFPALFAARKKAYIAKYGKEMEEAMYKNIVLEAYKNGNKNPKAQLFNAKMTLEKVYSSPQFLSNPDLHDYLRIAECSLVSDGAASCLVVSEEGLKKLGKKESDAIEILDIKYAAGNLFRDDDPCVMGTTKVNAERVYKSTGVKPQDIEVAELHDCFAMAQVLQNEALGWAKPGEGAFGLNTKVGVNLGGGLECFGHPTGATGVKQINEIYNQMKGLAGGYQMKKIPTLGIMSNMGGDDRTSVCGIFKNL